MRLITMVWIPSVLLSCGQGSRTEMIKGLSACDKDSICIASYYFGELGDKSVTMHLLTGIEDMRISHDVRHKGMSVYYCKMVALRKISGLDVKVGEHEKPDTTKINKFIDWAVDNNLAVDKEANNTRGCVN